MVIEFCFSFTAFAFGVLWEEGEFIVLIGPFAIVFAKE